MPEQYACFKCQETFDAEEGADQKPCPLCGAQGVVKSSDAIQGFRAMAEIAAQNERQGLICCIVLVAVGVVLAAILIWLAL